MDKIATIILAAGKGTRMKSDLPKVLHKVAGKSMVVHVAQAARTLSADHVHIVVGHMADQVQAEVEGFFPARFALQKALLGTGDAVKAALPDLDSGVNHVLVLCGDVPLIQPETLKQLVARHQDQGAVLSVLAVAVDQPKGYGRIIRDAAGELCAIREEADASDAEKQISLVNSGIYCFDKTFLERAIGKIGNQNNQGEYYLTDLVEIAVADEEKTCVHSIGDASQVMGVNTPSELARAQALFSAGADELS